MPRAFQWSKSLDSEALGYMTPKFQVTGVATKKTDMYAFGVVVLELLSREEALRFEFDDDGGYWRTSVVEMTRVATEENDDVRKWVGFEYVGDNLNKRLDMGNKSEVMVGLWVEVVVGEIDSVSGSNCGGGGNGVCVPLMEVVGYNGDQLAIQVSIDITPLTSGFLQATKKSEAIYPTLKKVGLGGSARSSVMKQVSLQIFSFATKTTGKTISSYPKRHRSVGKFVEFYRENMSERPLADMPP
ncbi:G-type lectin S-receptor serine/threonine-protein kinase [Spatholobus suberectus]|nr:G-type lectin S-receptor serine/threonine-protein kinase [Spatholobus suberectus]